jgi:hypothetical protein
MTEYDQVKRAFLDALVARRMAQLTGEKDVEDLANRNVVRLRAEIRRMENDSGQDRA